MICAKIIFIISSIFLSVATARHMVHIHGAKATLEEIKLRENTLLEVGKKRIERAEKELCHDYILNFIGTFLGWFSLYYLIFYRLGNQLSFVDLFLIFIAFVGIVGYLPHIVINKGVKP